VLSGEIKKKVKPSHYRHAGAKGERIYSSYIFLTLALYWGKWSASHPSCTLTMGMDSQYALDSRLGGPQNWSGHRG
jgi:hypothetical protein